ncbi:MAG: hypothetical protein LZF60_310168 [Nitrospira sp.]|nr:hypothetical protein [Nitrospira sp.]ULA61266.1 MAG: hypothetical protein LZF60_310168 [Nitrospira sp.]
MVRLTMTVLVFIVGIYAVSVPAADATSSFVRKGDLNLADCSHYAGVRRRGNVLRSHQFKQPPPPGAEGGTTHNTNDLVFPEVFSLFTGGTLAKNIRFFAELASNLEKSRTGIEQAFITFNGIGGETIANIRVGRIDPFGAFSFSTLRQQLDVMGESIHALEHAP